LVFRGDEYLLKYKSSQKEMERPVLGRELKTGPSQQFRKKKINVVQFE
jgi:hypothetical protein